MSIRTRLLGALALGGAVLPLAAAGTAAAATPPTSDAGQAASAGVATVANQGSSFLDAANGANRPHGADGDETEFPTLDYRFVEGPAGGLLDGPLD